MQLQPVVHCDVVERLGMSKSLFERYMEKALMLDTQYRMVLNYQNIALILYLYLYISLSLFFTSDSTYLLQIVHIVITD